MDIQTMRMEAAQLMIDTPGALQSLVERAGQCSSIALDTEFVWERTYFPKLGLVQVALSQTKCWLIDAIALDDLEPLGDLLSAAKPVKILHDAVQDLTILRRVTGVSPRNVFDTRCAAGLAGLSSTTSLGELVGTVVGIQLAKTESRTDWLRRPLTPEQLTYAVEDVSYLHEVRQKLTDRITALGRDDWLSEETAVFDDPSLYQEKDPYQQYQRVKGAGLVSRRELAILRELAAWREEEARHCDRPRNRVIPDALLLHLARRQPRSRDLLPSFKGLARRYDEVVLELIGRGLAVAAADCPWPRGRSRPADDKGREELFEQAMEMLRCHSAACVLDVPFVATRAELQALIWDGPQAPPQRHRLLRGWRRELIGQALLELMAGGQGNR